MNSVPFGAERVLGKSQWNRLSECGREGESDRGNRGSRFATRPRDERPRGMPALPMAMLGLSPVFQVSNIQQ